MAARALQLKEEGNLHFKKGDYVSAEALYSKAIIADPSNYNLYTNRAMARLKMNLWESVVSDCNECLQRNPDNIKAHYYLSQAYLPLHDYEGALQNGLRAHELCIQTGDKSLSAVTSQILRCKQERWDAKEKRRKRENSELETEMVVMMERERDQALSELGEDDDSYRREITEDWEHKIETMRSVFEKARSNEEKRRKVPDWAIDDISFGFMVDPVVTRTGKSYERASIIEHLNRQNTDPLTRAPLFITDLRPNLDLKQACEEFLEENGWAADW